MQYPIFRHQPLCHPRLTSIKQDGNRVSSLSCAKHVSYLIYNPPIPTNANLPIRFRRQPLHPNGMDHFNPLFFIVANPFTLLSQSKNTVVHAVHVHDHSLCSDGTLVQERALKRPSFAKLVLKSRTCARHVCWISNTAYLLK